MRVNKKVVLRSRLVSLRPYRKDDIGRWYQWFNDSEVTRYMEQGRTVNTFERQKVYLMKMHRSPCDLQLALICEKDGQLIGTVGLHSIDPVNRNADISVVIGEKAYRNEGLGKAAVGLLVRYAFKRLKLNKVTAGMFEDNLGSYYLFRSLGFSREGLLRKHVFKRNKYMNVIKLGLLAREYKGKEWIDEERKSH